MSAKTSVLLSVPLTLADIAAVIRSIETRRQSMASHATMPASTSEEDELEELQRRLAAFRLELGS